MDSQYVQDGLGLGKPTKAVTRWRKYTTFQQKHWKRDLSSGTGRHAIGAVCTAWKQHDMRDEWGDKVADGPTIGRQHCPSRYSYTGEWCEVLFQQNAKISQQLTPSYCLCEFCWPAVTKQPDSDAFKSPVQSELSDYTLSTHFSPNSAEQMVGLLSKGSITIRFGAFCVWGVKVTAGGGKGPAELLLRMCESVLVVQCHLTV